MSSVRTTTSSMCFVVACAMLMLDISNGKQPNVVFIMFDDLSMTEVSYNGGLINTAVLDSYASSGIRLNFHYSEQVCSPSRSAFMTGRYSWKSGLNSLAGQRKNAHFDRSAVLFSQLLQQAGYNVDIAGKWHIGYKYEGILPPNRGFQTGLYGHVGTGYYGNNLNKLFSNLDTDFPLTQGSLKKRRGCLFGKRLPTFDLFRIVDNGDGSYSEEATNIGHTSYVDDLYAEHTRAFIANQNTNTPFITILNLYTPHADTTDPPSTLPDTFGSISMLSKYTNTCEAPPVSTTNKTMICKQLLYAEELIKGIVDELKTQNVYDDTIIIIASDNGGIANTANSIEYAELMPLRGPKGGPFEGGTRTSVIMTGGWITNNVFGSSHITGCDYNNLMHISDWYHLFMKMADITTTASPLIYEPDSDHSALEIWQDIRCECGASKIPNLNQCEGAPFNKRTELIQMQTCSTEPHAIKPGFLTAKDNAEFFSSYIRKTINSTEYKLVVRGSQSILAECPLTQINTFDATSSYNERNGVLHAYPDWIYYNQYYVPFNTNYPTLFKSDCLDEIVANDPASLNDSSRAEFQYSDTLLYKISTDTIEACDISTTHSNIVTALQESLQDASEGYLVSDWNAAKSIGAFYSQLMSYKCKDYITTLAAWEGKNEDACNVSSTTSEIIDCNDVWQMFIRKGEQCCDQNPSYAHCSTYYSKEGCGGYTASAQRIIPKPIYKDYDINEFEVDHIPADSAWYQLMSFEASSNITMFVINGAFFIFGVCSAFLVIACTKWTEKQQSYARVMDSNNSSGSDTDDERKPFESE